MASLTYSDIKRMTESVAHLMQPRDPLSPFDHFPFMGRQTIAGMDVVESPDIPRYVLPEEVIPGVPWPKGFREEINAWSREFLGTTNAVQPGTAYVIANRYVMMRPTDVLKITNLA